MPVICRCMRRGQTVKRSRRFSIGAQRHSRPGWGENIQEVKDVLSRFVGLKIRQCCFIMRKLWQTVTTQPKK